MSAGDRRLLFLHLPKTAGSSFRRIIEKQYGPRAVWTIGDRTADDIDALVGLPASRLDRIRAIVGHIPYGLHRLLPWPVDYVTILREPVDRVVSHFYYASRMETSPLHQEVLATGGDLAAYVTRAPSQAYFNNGQTRLLGSADPKTAAPAGMPALIAAKRRLAEEFAFIGLTERLDDFVTALAAAYDWRRPKLRWHNRGSNRPPLAAIPAETRQTIERFNALDIDLYRYAAELASKRPASS